MAQKSIKSFFQSGDGAHSESDEEQQDFVQKTVEEYQELILQKENVGEYAQIKTSSATGSTVSECWKYFGNLYISQKLVLERKKFCVLCFQSANKILKG